MYLPIFFRLIRLVKRSCQAPLDVIRRILPTDGRPFSGRSDAADAGVISERGVSYFTWTIVFLNGFTSCVNLTLLLLPSSTGTIGMVY
jgi:hypothetical protein